MRSKLLVFFAFVAGPLIVCGPVFAHHGAATYSDRIVVLRDATVTKFQWGNPHSIVMFDVKDEKGNVTHWAAEAGSPSVLGLIGRRKTGLRFEIPCWLSRVRGGVDYCGMSCGWGAAGAVGLTGLGTGTPGGAVGTPPGLGV
jgi:hypothetical protein